jgi:hypothetical protein
MTRKKQQTRSVAQLALAATAAGFIIGAVGYAVAGQDWYQPVSITKSGANTTASGSVHDARFGGGAKDYIGCLSQWGTNWVECHAQQTLSGGTVRTAVCAITNIGELTSYNGGAHWLTMISMINETSGITFTADANGKCIPTQTSVWNSSDYL